MEECRGYSTSTPDGTEYDCEYEYSGEVSCDDCIFGNYGGIQDPRKNPYEDEVEEALLQEEKDLMIQIFGEIVSLKKLEDWLEWEEEQRQLEIETQRSFPY